MENSGRHALAVTLEERTPVLINYDVMWAPEPVWMIWGRY
jgi:hypothetical protein